MSKKDNLTVFKKEDLHIHVKDDAGFYVVKKTQVPGVNAKALSLMCATSIFCIYEIAKQLKKGDRLPTLAPLSYWAKNPEHIYIGKLGRTQIFSVAFAFDVIGFYSSNIKSMKFESVSKLVQFILDQAVPEPVVTDETDDFVVDQTTLPSFEDKPLLTKQEVEQFKKEIVQNEVVRDYDPQEIHTQLDVFYNTIIQLLEENRALKEELTKHKALPADYAALKRDQERLKEVERVLGKIG